MTVVGGHFRYRQHCRTAPWTGAVACIRPHPKIFHRQSVQLIDLLEVPLAERGIEPDARSGSVL